MKTTEKRAYNVSPSRIKLADKCMKAIDFRYNQRLQEVGFTWLRKGKFAHEVLHQLGLEFSKNPPPFDVPTEDAIKTVSNRIAQDFDASFAEIQESTNLIISRREKLKFTHTTDFEKWWYLDLDDGDVAGGIVDRIDHLPNGRVHLWDYKTGSYVPSRKEMMEDPQTLLYLAAAAQWFPFSPVSIVFWYLKRDALYRFDWSEESTQKAIEKAKGYLAKFRKAKETGQWEAKTGRHCRTCGFRAVCDAASGFPV